MPKLQSLEDVIENLKFAYDALLESAESRKTSVWFEEYYGTWQRIEELQSRDDVGEIHQNLIEKMKPKMRMMQKNGRWMNMQIASPYLSKLKKFLEDFENILHGSEKTDSQTVLVPKGRNFDGNKALRSLLGQAKVVVQIRDSYLSPRTLDVVSEFLDSDGVSFRLLRKEEKSGPFVQALRALTTQHTDSRIEARLSKSNSDHYRLIVIDNQNYYLADHSLSEWGHGTVRIDRIADPDHIKVYQNLWNKEWGESSPIH